MPRSDRPSEQESRPSPPAPSIRASDAQGWPCELASCHRPLFDLVRQRKLSLGSDENLFATMLACKHVVERSVEGDFVECGVWRGGQAILASGVLAGLGSQKRIWMYDTFAGMTAPTEADVDHRGRQARDKSGSTHTSIENDWVYASLTDVKNSFSEAGLEPASPRHEFVVGDVCVALRQPHLLPARISVLRLDTDWYESTRTELEVLYPRLSLGGVLIVDDYGHWSGARKAVDEYFSRVPRPFLQFIDYTARMAVKYTEP